jgi:predicted ATP-grasp superfamily ATP-dependent carboligase
LDLYHRKIPAVVLGSGITALGVVRSLSKIKIPVYLLSSKKEFVGYSKSVIQLKSDLNEFPGTEELINILDKTNIGKSVLFPCSDSLLKSVVNIPVIKIQNIFQVYLLRKLWK